MLRVLIVDDSRDDAELTEFALREAGLEFESRVLCRPDALAAALEGGFAPDLVLCDFNLPGWSCGEVLKAVQLQVPDACRVILTGALPPEGHLPEADAVVLKDDLRRLVALARRVAQTKPDQMV